MLSSTVVHSKTLSLTAASKMLSFGFYLSCVVKIIQTFPSPAAASKSKKERNQQAES